MTLHREGKATILIGFLAAALVSVPAYYFISPIWASIISAPFWMLFAIIVYFFRIPNRTINAASDIVLAPADGTIVAIEETTENEYFGDKRIQVSIFMSPLNVHVNLYPISGLVKYYKYHPGKFFVASLPKSATDNERTSTVLRDSRGKELLVRQVAGALARRIVAYVKTGTQVAQGEELGFIKFGSRVDLYLPLDSELLVEMNQKVEGKLTAIARW